MLTYTFARLDELSPRDVLDLLGARQAVFVVEQACIYMDVDGLDPGAHHLLARDAGPDRELLGYLRVLAPGAYYPEPSVGRVLTTSRGRGRGLGRELMREGITRTEALYPGHDIRINAQLYLDRFYRELGFAAVRGPYDVDGIPHQEMVRRCGGEG